MIRRDFLKFLGVGAAVAVAPPALAAVAPAAAPAFVPYAYTLHSRVLPEYGYWTQWYAVWQDEHGTEWYCAFMTDPGLKFEESEARAMVDREIQSQRS